jgi:glutamate formiminotransferase
LAILITSTGRKLELLVHQVQIVECMPNFSTSDPKTVEQILQEIRKVRNVFLLDYTFDDYYNRLVVSFVGGKRSVVTAALNSAEKAVALIDMRKHKGQHPRLGAVDVVPFIPIRETTLEECVELAKKFGKDFAHRCRVPVYLYGVAAANQHRGDLDWIREGEYERLSKQIIISGREPDYGPAKFVPSFGATITGARKVMAGFNVNIGTSDLKVAKKIAKALHGHKGGFSNVKAMAAYIPEKNISQIGMSINDFERTPIYRVYELLKLECQRYNVPIICSEFCGLAPLKALIDTSEYYLKIDNLSEDQILEIAVQKAIEKGGSFE